MPLGVWRKGELVYKISSVGRVYCVCKSKITIAMKRVRTSKKCELRTVIKFLKIHKYMCNVYGEGTVISRQDVYKWICLFNMGRMETHDEEHAGFGEWQMIETVQMFLSNDQWLTATNIFNKIAACYSYVNVNRTSVYHILWNELDMTKVSAGGSMTFDGQILHTKNGHHFQIFESWPHGWKWVSRANCNWRWNPKFWN